MKISLVEFLKSYFTTILRLSTKKFLMRCLGLWGSFQVTIRARIVLRFRDLADSSIAHHRHIVDKVRFPFSRLPEEGTEF
jgi:hypothetical protein